MVQASPGCDMASFHASYRAKANLELIELASWALYPTVLCKDTIVALKSSCMKRQPQGVAVNAERLI
ncbi:unnamed protein product [Tetraodon nigroviridis]|uniref:(spotted green pufferfish) hypothetical protein n=1 Tax=Tetraodon nigroviridis TaxID=99883 RepID=Q4RT96_TETNG|nr:unnamed protein product [Tetraodon nigroviridis]